MENIERRLELIRLMRSEQEENRGRIRKRENILYPNRKLSYSDPMESNSYAMKYQYQEKESGREENISNNFGFYMRVIICMALFLTFVYMETQNISYFGVTDEKIQEVVSSTMDVNSFAFMKQFPYTLEE